MGYIASGNPEITEHPQHRVTVPQFYMGKYPITNAQWKAVMQTNPSAEQGEKFRGDRQPVVNVSRHDAQAFCQKLIQLAKRNYRLPSEAEWEYACRAENQKAYSFGKDENQLENYAWYSGNSNGQTHPVGKKKSNTFGLYDMYGNVWEWCADHWHDTYQEAPTNGSVWLSSEDENQYRIIRGGSWNCDPGNCRSAYRDFISSGYRSNLIGFRVVCSAP